MPHLALAALLFLCPQDDEGGFLGLHEAEARVTIGDFDLLLSGLLEAEVLSFDEYPPGLIVAEDSFYHGRATFFADATVGEHLYFFMQARADRNFDPHDFGHDFRVDEYFGRWSTWGDDWTASVQLGKFATPIGNFVPRHDAMNNPFLRAPIAYDHVTNVHDKVVVPGNAALINRRDSDDQVHKWVTMIWGPVYHSGGLATFTSGDWDLRLAVTNAAPSERPYSWDWRRGDDEAMAASGRIGWTAFTGFKLGVNAAQGAYLQRFVDDLLRSGREIGDYPQRLAGADLEYGFGHLTAFAEVFVSDWKIPNIDGRPRATAWSLEARYSLSELVLPGLFVAARAGQILFDDLRTAAGHSTPWDRTTWRAELAAGWAVKVNLLLKAEVMRVHTNGPHDNDDDLVAFAVVMSW